MQAKELYLVGTSYKLSDVDFRESLIENLDSLKAKIQSYEEILELVTCNRVELYFTSDSFDSKNFDMRDKFYIMKGPEAVEHLLKVALGYDSFLPGEESIYYQVKKSLTEAVKRGSARSALKYVFNRVIYSSRRFRSARLHMNGKEIASEIAKLALKEFDKPPKTLIVGSGRTSKLIYRQLRESGVKEIYVSTSRNLFAEEFKGAKLIKTSDIKDYLENFDLVFSATNSMPKKPIITFEMLTSIKKLPQLIVDLGVPRNVDKRASSLHIRYWDMDVITKMLNGFSYKESAGLEEALKRESELIYLGAYYKKLNPALKSFLIKVNAIIDSETEEAFNVISKKGLDRSYLKKMAQRVVAKTLANLLYNPYSEEELKEKLRALSILEKGVNYEAENSNKT